MKYYPQLDGFRALAVLSVMATHWIPSYGDSPFNVSLFGVRGFFVLSGFLITLILLKSRRHSSKTESLKNFYARRFLRIFPLYYGVILILALLGVEVIQRWFFWHFFYLTNVLTFINQDWPGLSGHFWTLAVEEQFYLIWPWVILYLPERALKPFIVGCLIASPVVRIILYSCHLPLISIDTFPLCSVDALAFGGLMAYYKEYRPRETWPQAAFDKTASAAVIMYVAIQSSGISVRGMGGVCNVLAVIVTGWIIFRAAEGFNGMVGSFLSAAPLVYLGKISYGLYVLHAFMPILLNKILEATGYSHLSASESTRAPLYFVLAVAAASCSWLCYERPILRLKKRFPQGGREEGLNR